MTYRPCCQTPFILELLLIQPQTRSLRAAQAPWCAGSRSARTWRKSRRARKREHQFIGLRPFPWHVRRARHQGAAILIQSGVFHAVAQGGITFSHTVFQHLRLRHAGVIVSSNTIDTIHARKAITNACPSTERFNNVRNLCLQIKQH